MMIQLNVRIYGFQWTVPRLKAFSGSSAWPWLFLTQKMEGLCDDRHLLITILQLKDARLFTCPWHNAPLQLIQPFQPLSISEWICALFRRIMSASLLLLSDHFLSAFRRSLLFQRNLLHKMSACFITTKLENSA